MGLCSNSEVHQQRPGWGEVPSSAAGGVSGPSTALGTVGSGWSHLYGTAHPETDRAEKD